MTTVELLEAFRDALKNDSALKSWCLAEFNKEPVIYLGLNEEDPPPVDEYPIVAIVGITHSIGESKREITWEVDLGAGVIQEEIVIDEGSKTFKGFLQAETLRRLAEEALYRAKLVTLDSQNEAGNESIYPLFVSYSTVTGALLRTTRQALPVF